MTHRTAVDSIGPNPIELHSIDVNCSLAVTSTELAVFFGLLPVVLVVLLLIGTGAL
jgi:hypothetical protein